MGTTKATADCIDGAREKAGLTRRDLSSASGIAYETLRRKLGGHTPFNVEEIDACARAMGVEAETLVVFEAA
jgi:transcriptional regulator with XRE-family HTH domain